MLLHAANGLICTGQLAAVTGFGFNAFKILILISLCFILDGTSQHPLRAKTGFNL